MGTPNGIHTTAQRALVGALSRGAIIVMKRASDPRAMDVVMHCTDPFVLMPPFMRVIVRLGHLLNVYEVHASSPSASCQSPLEGFRWRWPRF